MDVYYFKEATWEIFLILVKLKLNFLFFFLTQIDRFRRYNESCIKILEQMIVEMIKNLKNNLFFIEIYTNSIYKKKYKLKIDEKRDENNIFMTIIYQVQV